MEGNNQRADRNDIRSGFRPVANITHGVPPETSTTACP